MELKLLSAMMKHRPAYTELKDHVTESELSPQGWQIYKEIEKYYEADSATKSVDREILLARLQRRMDNPKHFDMFKTLVAQMPEDVSGINVAKEFIDAKLYALGLKLSHALASGLGTKDARKLMEEWQHLDSTHELENPDEQLEVSQGTDIESLISDFSADHLLPIFPSELNDKLGGGLVGGDHMFVFGRPEVGKTAHALTFLRRPARDGKRCLYIGNEDAHKRVLRRAITSFAGITWDECLKDPAKAYQKAVENGYANVVFVSLSPGTVPIIEELVKQHEAELSVIDQVGNLLSKQDNKTLQLGGVMQGIRNIGKKHGCAMISFWQAGDSATGKLVLEMEDVNWSNTDMQAACDIMVGIGMDSEFERKDMRMHSLCKNKLTGDHSFYPVLIDRQCSRIRSLK